MVKPAHSGIRKILRSFGYARDGLTAIWRDEISFRQEIYVIAPAILIALLLPFAWWEKALLIFSALQILLAELANTAIEILADLISADYHPQIKKAKDLGALLVLLAIIAAAVMWIGIIARGF